jgi:TonB family protein
MRTIAKRALLTVTLLIISPFNRLMAQQEGTVNDEEVRIVDWEELKYPPNARLARVQGVVVVRVTLDDGGRVVGAVAISGNKGLIPDCLANSKKWRFEPNSKKTAVIVYQFRIENGFCHDYGSSHFVIRPPNFASITNCDRPAQP